MLFLLFLSIGGWLLLRLCSADDYSWDGYKASLKAKKVEKANRLAYAKLLDPKQNPHRYDVA